MNSSKPSVADPAPHRTTGELLNLLQQDVQIQHILEENAEEFVSRSFPELLSAFMERSGLSALMLGQKALLSKPFTYQLLDGTRNPKRDIVLRLAVVLGLSVDETQILLRSAGRGALYPRVPRDAAIIHALGRHMTLTELDEVLAQLGETPIV